MKSIQIEIKTVTVLLILSITSNIKATRRRAVVISTVCMLKMAP